MRIFNVTTYQDIAAVLYCCRQDFFNQQLNDAAKIQALSEKFAQFGRVLAAYDGETPAGFVAYYVNSETKVSYISMIIIQKILNIFQSIHPRFRNLLNLCQSKL